MEKTIKGSKGPEVIIPINKSKVEFLHSGFNAVPPFTPGDFILVHRTILFSKLIRIAQRLRYPKQYAYWNHVVLIVSPEGDIIEALARGVVSGNISKYRSSDYYLVRILANSTDAAEIKTFADYVVENHSKYSISAIISLFFTLLFGSRIMFAKSGTYICSGLVATALTRAGAIFKTPPEYVTPADLAQYYNVNPQSSKERLKTLGK